MSFETLLAIIGLIVLLPVTFRVLMPDLAWRVGLWLIARSIYNLRVHGRENLPKQGPMLIVGNHTSYMDGQLVGASVPFPVRFMIFHIFFESIFFKHILRWIKAIPVKSTTKGIERAMKDARQRLENGEVVCVFPEGAVSRTGNLMPFRRGFEKIIDGIDAPIVPVYIDGLWNSVFSYQRAENRWRQWLREFRKTVDVTIGKPLPPTSNRFELYQAIRELSATATENRQSIHDLLPLRFISVAKGRMRQFCMADSTGKNLTYGKTLIGMLVLRRWINQHHHDEAMLGLLLPSTVGGALCNLAVSLTGKVPVNLNFTAGKEAMDAIIDRCELKTIFTSRLFLKKVGLEERGGMVFLEDVMKDITGFDRLRAALTAIALPTFLLKWLVRPKRDAEDLATIIFSSGSTGEPKGAMLSHKNILANSEAVQQVFRFSSQDKMMGILPFFHSFGYSDTIWLPLVSGFGVVYHPNPMDGKVIGDLIDEHKVTLLISTPTFLNSYIRKCSKEQFESLRLVVSGAEKLQPQIGDAFRDHFGKEIMQGYGCTETGPVVSVNIPDRQDENLRQIGHKLGTIGQPVPSVAVRVVNIDSHEPLPLNEEGMLLAGGPSVMKGYYKQPDRTHEAFTGGWYITGDIARLDEDGFITITDRLARFSKIGGEMVPHCKIENAANEIVGEACCVVCSVPDEKKGESLVMFYNHDDYNAETLWQKLSETGIPKLWIPKRDQIFHLEEIPTLGSGKLDLKKVNQIAKEKVQEQQS